MKEWISSKFHPWKSREKVWLEGRNLKLCYPSKKLTPRREGPFEIIQVISPMAYKLQLPPTWKIHNVFHASLLSSYREILEHELNFSNPPSDLIRGEEEYEIDKSSHTMEHKDGGSTWYPGKGILQQKTCGNWKGTYNMRKLC